MSGEQFRRGGEPDDAAIDAFMREAFALDRPSEAEAAALLERARAIGETETQLGVETGPFMTGQPPSQN